MRIVGGISRGKSLVTPSDGNVRPTSDRVREALFNILGHRTPPLPNGAQVLDLFAGTGALGLEALSRGATHVYFLDNAAPSLALIRTNIERMGIDAQTSIIRSDAISIRQAQKTMDLVFVDPPYGTNLIEPALAAAHDQGWIGAHTIIVVEADSRDDVTVPNELVLEDKRRYGNTTIRIFLLAP